MRLQMKPKEASVLINLIRLNPFYCREHRELVLNWSYIDVKFMLTFSERKCELTQVAKGRFCSALQWNEEELIWVAATTLMLYKEQVLPLKEACQAHIKTYGVDGDVDSAAGSEVIIGKLRNQ